LRSTINRSFGIRRFHDQQVTSNRQDIEALVEAAGLRGIAVVTV